MTQLTLGAIAAQVCRVQLHLTAGGCVPEGAPPLGGALGNHAFANWLHRFHQDCLATLQVRFTFSI